METFLKSVVLVVVALVTAIVSALVCALFLMIAWNYVIPAVFGLPTIDFFQAWALLVVAGLIMPKASATSSSK